MLYICIRELVLGYKSLIILKTHHNSTYKYGIINTIDWDPRQPGLPG